MNYPKSNRVIVIDDQLDHGMAMLEALYKEGAAALYFSGVFEKLPSSPLHGIRLIITDLRLGTDSGDARADLGPAVSVLQNLIHPSNGPYAVIAWSQHPEDAAEFERMIREAVPESLPVAVLSIPKAEMHKDGSEEYDISKIWGALQVELEKTFPFDLLLSWEQAVHDATDATSSELAKQANQLCQRNEGQSTPDMWCEALTKVVASLIQADGGRQSTSEALMAASLYSILNALHTDRLEQTGLDPCPITSHGKDQLQRVWAKNEMNDTGRAKLNTMLLTSVAGLEKELATPGSLYLRQSWDGEENAFPFDETEVNDFIYHVFNPDMDPDIQAMQQRKLAGETISRTSIDRAGDRLREGVKGSWKPFIFEVTPSCDYVQAKQKINRFIFGVLVPASQINMVRNADYLKVVGPTLLGENQDPMYMVISSRHPVTLKLRALKPQPVMRLRNHVLSDIQSWLAGQSARVGYVSL